MLQQNTIANELLNGPAIYSDLFKQALRQQICSKLCAEDDLEISVHDKELCDDAGNLYFHIGFNQTFKHQFFIWYLKYSYFSFSYRTSNWRRKRTS